MSEKRGQTEDESARQGQAMKAGQLTGRIVVAESVREKRADRRRECKAGTGNKGWTADRKDCSSRECHRKEGRQKTRVPGRDRQQRLESWQEGL